MKGSDENQDWSLNWQKLPQEIENSQHFDGVALLCTNFLDEERLPAGEVMIKHKGQVAVEQTIDFIKSPVEIRPMWLHSPRRLSGLTLLILIAVLVASLLEHEVRRQIAQTGELLHGLMPENRDNPYPTAKKMLEAFQDYSLVLVCDDHGQEEIHYPQLRPVQKQIWTLLGLPPVPT